MFTKQFNDTVFGLTAEMDKVIIGYAEIKRFSIAGLFCDQHILLVGVPGTAKSLFAEVLQGAIGDSKAVRIQMTADVKPMDLVGVKVFNQAKGAFDYEMGPLHGVNFPLFDEFNRAQGKTVSAALSAMQERRIYINGKPFDLPDPYFCMATQNPVEQEGVYPLPEAAVDRFGAQLTVPYATAEEEEKILDTPALDQRDPQSVIKAVVPVGDVVKLREAIKKGVFVSPAARQYIVALVRATRPGLDEHKAVCAKSKELNRMVTATREIQTQKRNWLMRMLTLSWRSPAVDERIAVLAQDGFFGSSIEVGGSVRGQMSLRGFARVLAAMKGRSYITPEDIQEALLPCMRHRTAMTFEATSEGYTSDQALAIIQEHVPFDRDDNKYAPSQAA